MGNVCLNRHRSTQIETDSTIKLEDETQRRVIFHYLLEKVHKLRTDESRNRINSDLKEIYDEYDLQPEQTINKDTFLEKEKLEKALKHYEKLFNLLHLETYGLFKTNNFLEVTKDIVINYYGHILLHDKCFNDM